MLETGNREVRFFNFEIEKGFLEKIASFKDLKCKLVGFCQVHSRQVFWAIGMVNGKIQRCKKQTNKQTKNISFWKKEKKCVKSKKCQEKA